MPRRHALPSKWATYAGIRTLGAGSLESVDGFPRSCDDTVMSDGEPTPIPPDVLADLEEVLRQAARGRVTDPDLIRRVTRRAEQVRQEILREHGILNVAVDLIREGRDEE